MWPLAAKVGSTRAGLCQITIHLCEWRGQMGRNQPEAPRDLPRVRSLGLMRVLAFLTLPVHLPHLPGHLRRQAVERTELDFQNKRLEDRAKKLCALGFYSNPNFESRVFCTILFLHQTFILQMFFSLRNKDESLKEMNI